MITGIVLAVMISLNGNLSAQFGAFPAAAIIHIVGLVVAGVCCLFQKEKKKLLGQGSIWIYSGGAIGVLTTVFQNMAFGNISMTSIVALSLFGQTVMALVVDGLGLFGMRKQPFRFRVFIGVAFALAGIVYMLDQSVTSAILAVAVSFVSGIAIVLSRTACARLAEKTGALRSSLMSHLIGLPITILLALVLGSGGAPGTSAGFHPWVYLGGVLGVAVIFLCNLTVPRVPAFRLSILSFVGQVFTGVILDVLFGGEYSQRTFIGGIVIAVGMGVYLLMEYIAGRKRTDVRSGEKAVSRKRDI